MFVFFTKKEHVLIFNFVKNVKFYTWEGTYIFP